MFQTLGRGKRQTQNPSTEQVRLVRPPQLTFHPDKNVTRVYSSYLADLLKLVQYTRENLSYLADLLKFVQYTIGHLSTFLSGQSNPQVAARAQTFTS